MGAHPKRAVDGDASVGSRTIADDLEVHQTNTAWPLKEVARFCHTWLARFSVEFKLQTPKPVLRLGRFRGECGHFLADHNDFGLRNEIGVSLWHLEFDQGDQKGLIDLLDTLAHELLHLWEAVHSPETIGRRNHHSKRFRDKARSVGLLVDKNGVSLGVLENSLFVDALKRYGVSVPDGYCPPAPARGPGSKLKLWECACEQPIKLRIARGNVRILCEDCGARFVRRDGT